MGMLIDGEWSDADDRRSDKQGAFQRVESKFRDRVSADGASGFRASPGAITSTSRTTARGRTAPPCSARSSSSRT